ncbi:VVA0879 family protein [Alicyclobacillus dauci]|uniref:Uncharacterized protein n=1 Tax=Alicyclobacillus dauci TaxID=1475485 RepID=A0ABY6Z7S7_9BACL|nr:VVA0879 family protein [Alicyclobacillus dauci]WAH38583.1 hypothetical protein NZD86_08925 [Alicyclobacillus dauci]
MEKQTLEEWRKEATERYGEKGRDWKFKCPRCGNVQCGQDFMDRGMSAEEAANQAYQGCIGRSFKDIGCDWAAYGLFGTMGTGRIVITPEGEEVEVFDFA